MAQGLPSPTLADTTHHPQTGHDMNIEASPEAIRHIKGKHVRVLEHRLHHLEGMRAIGQTNDWRDAEIAALRVAIAELNELLEERMENRQHV